MVAPKSFGTHLKIRVMTGPVQLRPGPGQRFAGAIHTGEVHDAYLSTDGWLSIPTVRALGLMLHEWKARWDDLKIEIEHQVSGHWESLEDEADWQELSRRGVHR